jgi:hypothetical protein
MPKRGTDTTEGSNNITKDKVNPRSRKSTSSEVATAAETDNSQIIDERETSHEVSVNSKSKADRFSKGPRERRSVYSINYLNCLSDHFSFVEWSCVCGTFTLRICGGGSEGILLTIRRCSESQVSSQQKGDNQFDKRKSVTTVV